MVSTFKIQKWNYYTFNFQKGNMKCVWFSSPPFVLSGQQQQQQKIFFFSYIFFFASSSSNFTTAVCSESSHTLPCSLIYHRTKSYFFHSFLVSQGCSLIKIAYHSAAIISISLHSGNQQLAWCLVVVEDVTSQFHTCFFFSFLQAFFLYR